MSDEIEYNCEQLNITFTNKNGKLTLLKRYKIFYKTREIRFHFRYPEPNQLHDYEKMPYPNMVFWQYLEDLKIINAHIYFEPTKHIIYIHHDRHIFTELIDLAEDLHLPLESHQYHHWRHFRLPSLHKYFYILQWHRVYFCFEQESK